MNFYIRPIQSSDRDFILSLAPRFSEFDLPEWRSPVDIDHASHIRLERALQIPEPGSTFFLAEDEGGKPAGFIHLQTQIDYFNGQDFGYIADLAVDTSFEGQGAGRALMKKAEEWATEQGYFLLTLNVFGGNTRARELYERSGFQPEVIRYVKVIERK
jgi:ribosomal protein S18 acetylase RimI-like enzyme